MSCLRSAMSDICIQISDMTQGLIVRIMYTNFGQLFCLEAHGHSRPLSSKETRIASRQHLALGVVFVFPHAFLQNPWLFARVFYHTYARRLNSYLMVDNTDC